MGLAAANSIGGVCRAHALLQVMCDILICTLKLIANMQPGGQQGLIQSVCVEDRIVRPVVDKEGFSQGTRS